MQVVAKILTMFFLKLLMILLMTIMAFVLQVGFAISTVQVQQDLSITYHGFRSATLSLDGIVGVTPDGLLELTNVFKQEKGNAFYPNPINFKNNSPNASAFSFSTTFVFAIVSRYPTLSGPGMAFVIAPTRGLPDSLPSQYLGLFNNKNVGNPTNHVVAVELDTILSSEFEDINDNHVGIDINGLKSEQSAPAGYYADGGNGEFQNLSLISGKPLQVWVDYDGASTQMNVTLATMGIRKPKRPLLSLSYDLSPVLIQTMYIGFSSSTGSIDAYHYVLGWSFRVNGGEAQALDLSRLPNLPGVGGKQKSKLLTIGVPAILIVSFSIGIILGGVIYWGRKKKKFAEVLEDWELEYGPHRFKYKDLYIATKGFRDQGLLGRGGFGRVYRGVLPRSKMEVAVKRVSHESRQGLKEFVAEIVSIGRLRHRNLVPLLGYCRRKDELLLVYEYMPNGSLDKLLYDQPEHTLNWKQRFRVIKGVASGLCYLHEGWEQLVIHRDVKASNVLLDGESNGRLGDFGLSRLYDHGTDPQTTDVAGTLGYLAPENIRTGKATTSTDVYAFGVFLLEVVCGRRPIINPRSHSQAEDAVLVDWVVSFWKNGENILEAMDPNIKGIDYVEEEVELVMKLGLLCSHFEPTRRPSMHQVVLYLDGALELPELSSRSISSQECFGGFLQPYPSSMAKAHSQAASITTSLLFEGR